MKKLFKRLFLTVALVLGLFASYFLLVRKLDNDALEAKDFYSPADNTDATGPVLLPSLFIDGQRFYIKLATAGGDTALAYGDTGGGISMILPSAVDKLNLQSMVRTALLKGIMPVKYIPFGDVAADGKTPSPLPLRSKVLRRFLNPVAEPFLLIPPMDEELQFMTEVMKFDLFLGQNFFMGKSWTFDYRQRQVWANTPLAGTEEGRPGVQRLGFKKNSAGEKIFGHPSMSMEAEGETIPVLFDTGASIVLSESGRKAFHTSEKTIGASFIAASVFDRWRKAHPEWKYYEKADAGRDVIEVPIIKISGLELGPVLFARRPDEAWSEGMIHSMDKLVKGAIGGSALQYLRVIIDYNSGMIKFEKPDAI